MHAEWWVLSGLLVWALLLLRSHFRSLSFAAWTGCVALLLIASTVGWQRYLQKNETSNREFHARLPHPQQNEYVSSANCRSCHPDQYASWHRSFHRTMTQLPSPKTVRGSFDNVRL